MISSFPIDIDEEDEAVKILYILKSTPDASTKKIIEVQSAGNQTRTVDLTKGSVDYDQLVADVFSNDKVYCW
jgi:hypothetical protein